MSSSSFQAIATLFQFVFSLFLFVWVIKNLILPRRRNRKSKYAPLKFKLPSKYIKRPMQGKAINGENLDGLFTKEGSNIVIVSRNLPTDIDKRKNTILIPNTDDYSIRFLEDGWKSINNIDFFWIKTVHERTNETLKMISYIFTNKSSSIEIGCGSLIENFSKYNSDYNELIESMKLTKNAG